ncbi:family 43 glycosylhydrolase [Algoriphagus aestuarii]|nr:family 43 glycosylhydrolase [Algoriphagus aestuarii]
MSFFLLLSSCFYLNALPFSELVKQDFFKVQSDSILFKNPVFKPVLADPTLIQEDGYFYAFGTEDNWGEEGGYHLVAVIRSRDLVHWDLLGNAMTTKPNWKPKGGIWAPDVTKVGDQFYMYYSFSTWGDPNPGIGLAIADQPAGPFVDQGPVFTSEEIGVANSIDPFYFEEKGEKYLIWGSFHGLYVTQLSPDGRKAEGKKVKLAGNHLEAAYLFKRGNLYYLFGSSGTCCEGANSTYRVLVGRSKNLFGPYLDKEGNELLGDSAGSLVVKTNSGAAGFAGPGHNAEIITDDSGQDWILYHGMDKEKPKLKNGTNRRLLLMDPLIWQEGWPSIKNQEPSTFFQPVPIFIQEKEK